MNADLHPDIAFLAPILGTWKGAGRGDYPTIDGFDYLEEITFSTVGKPFVAYTQRTRSAATGLPMHAETGYLRPCGGDGVEFVVVQPTGVVEIHEGSFVDGRLSLATVQVASTATAKSVEAVVRTMHFSENECRYTLDMAAVGQPMGFHLEASLERVAA